MTEMPVFAPEYIKVHLNKEESNSSHVPTSESAILGRRPATAGRATACKCRRSPPKREPRTARVSYEVQVSRQTYARAACRIVFRMNMKSRESRTSPIIATFESSVHSALVISRRVWVRSSFTKRFHAEIAPD